MKLSTALRNAEEIARRVRSVNGLLATPMCSAEAVRFRRIWIFGSTVKGSEYPNDLDVLIDMERVGRIVSWKSGMPFNKAYYRDYGVFLPLSSEMYALKWLSRGMKKVSRHPTYMEAADIDVKVLIYPRFDLCLNRPRKKTA